MAQCLRCCATNREVTGSIPAGVSGNFHWHKILPIALWPWVDSSSNRNEYQDHFLGVKAAGAYGWQPYHNPVPLSCNLGTLTSWNPPGHSRPVTGLLYLLHLLLTTNKRMVDLTLRKPMSRPTAFSTVTTCSCSKAWHADLRATRRWFTLGGEYQIWIRTRNRVFGVGDARGHRMATNGVKQTGVSLRSI